MARIPHNTCADVFLLSVWWLESTNADWFSKKMYLDEVVFAGEDVSSHWVKWCMSTLWMSEVDRKMMDKFCDESPECMGAQWW